MVCVIATDPYARHLNATKLQNRPGYRLQVGDWRVSYEIEGDELVILRENSLSAEWLACLPLFVRLIQVEEFLHFVQYIDEPDEEMQAQLDYKIKCIEDDIPYMGFYDSIYSPERPFSL